MSNDTSNNNPITPRTPTLAEAIAKSITQLASNLQTQVPQIAQLAEEHRLELQRLRTSLDQQVLAHTISQSDAETYLQKSADDFAHTEEATVAQFCEEAEALVTILKITVLDLVHAHVANADQ